MSDPNQDREETSAKDAEFRDDEDTLYAYEIGDIPVSDLLDSRPAPYPTEEE